MYSRNRSPVLASLFLLYFLIYSASPLVYIHEDNNLTSSRGCAHQTSSVSMINVFFFEALFSNLSQNADDDLSPYSCRFLIKKKRAVLRMNSLLDAVHFRSSEEPAAFSLQFPVIGAVFDHAQTEGQSARQGFSALHSGLSPPFA